MLEKLDSLAEEYKDHNCQKYSKMIECNIIEDIMRCKLCGRTWKESCGLKINNNNKRW